MIDFKEFCFRFPDLISVIDILGSMYDCDQFAKKGVVHISAEGNLLPGSS